MLTVRAQQPSYFQFDETNGLPDHEIYDIIEDSHGNLWLAANNGIFKYDGVNFTTYNNPTKRGLSVFGLQEDDKGRVWCINMSGQIMFVEHECLEIFYDISNISTGKYLHEFKVLNDNVYITTDIGLLRVELGNKKYFLFKSENSSEFLHRTSSIRIIDDQVWYIEKLEDKGNLLQSKIMRIDPKGSCHVEKEVDNFVNIYKTKNNFFLNKTDSKNSLNFTNLHLYSLENNNVKKLNDNETESSIRTVYITEDEAGYYWQCTDKGAFRYRIENDSIIDKEIFFPGIFVTKVLQDKNGKYWFSTLSDGIFLVKNLNIKFYNTNNSNIAINDIRALVKDENEILYYTIGEGGIGKFDPSENDFEVLQAPQTTNISSPSINIKYDPEDKSLFLIGPRLYHWIDGKYTSLGFAHWKDCSVLSDSTLFFSSTSKSGIVKNFLNSNGNKYLNSPKELMRENTQIFKDKRSYVNHYSEKNRKLYVGYIDGLVVYNEELDPESIHFLNNPIFATDITETSDGIVWVSSFKDGVLGLKGNEITEIYNKQNGLISDQVIKIMNDVNNICVVTKTGINYLNRNLSKDNTNIVTIDSNDGLDIVNINDIEITKNHIFLGSQKGLIQIDKRINYSNSNPPNINIEKIIVNDSIQDFKKKYELPFNLNDIEVIFNSTLLKGLTNKQYKYYIEGLSQDWIITNNNSIRLHSLSPGTYTFMVKAINEDLVESINSEHITFQINKPYWKTYWFYLFIGLILSIILLFILKIRINIIRKNTKIIQDKRATELELINSKLETLRSQMNPHFIFNALNSIQEYILTNKKDLASDYLGKFADLIRMYLDYSRTDFISLKDELNALKLYLELEKLRFEENFVYDIEIKQSKLNIDHIYIPSLLIQPYVENAIQHGLLHKSKNRKLKITFSKAKNEQFLNCEIFDNGIGRSQSAKFNQMNKSEHNSFASDAGKTRLQLLNYKNDTEIGLKIIDLESNGIAIGTKVILNIPVL